MAAPTASGESFAALLKLTYDATGLVGVKIVAEPIVAWVFDQQVPSGATPVTPSPLPPVPPDTGAIKSPQWAVAYPGQAIVFAAGESFAGPMNDFLTWLATNNGAHRTISAQLGAASFVNEWNEWAFRHPSLVG